MDASRSGRAVAGRRPRYVIGFVLALAALALSLPASTLAVANILDNQQGLPDLDARTGTVAPTNAQLSLVRSMGANATWNRFGTPQSLIKYGGYLATGLSGKPVDAARAWIRSNRTLFRLTAADVDNLELVNNSPIVGTSGHAVLFRQRFGQLAPTQDGLITVGVKGSRVFYVSSSAAGSQAAPRGATLTPTMAFLAAAANVGRPVNVGDVTKIRQDNSWTVLSVKGLATPLKTGLKSEGRVDQRVRLVAFPTYTDGVRSAYETLVVDVQGGSALAYKVFVDARNGQILMRQNEVDQIARVESGHDSAESPKSIATDRNGTFHGSYPVDVPPADRCGPDHPITVDADNRTIAVAVAEENTVNDIILYLKDQNGNAVASSDEATSPEAVIYSLPGGAGQVGDWAAQVCESPNPIGDSIPPTDYDGFFIVTDQSQPNPNLFELPAWQFFTSNPLLGDAHPSPYPVPNGWPYPDDDVRTSACWDTTRTVDPPCALDLTPNNGNVNTASRAPWDVNVATTTPSFTTLGNNADTAESWTSPLSPGPLGQRPGDLDRTYGYNDVPPDPLEQFTNAWNNSKCDPTTLVPGGNDILASVTNLFAGHNRFHDFAYHLGFTEVNFNLQTNNFGNSAPGPYPAGREGDPELGDVQAGALTGGAPSYLGRDNANQITLNDGIPGITNQYLFQPIAGAFYSPCVDGDFDTGVFGHEYTHAISNRMVGGPDASLTGAQAGAMGESWSDQDALEYQHEFNFDQGGNRWAEGVYVTGNHDKGIRDYSLDQNPLNYSDIGFDTPGVEVHADGEVWNGVAYTVRQALVKKYNHKYPESNVALQKACADGEKSADDCPGNRRWIQIVYDAFLLEPANVSMLDARDAYLAADQNRFGGVNQCTLWKAFAYRGMGFSASTAGTNDPDPKAAFDLPSQCSGNAKVTFNITASDGPRPWPKVPAKIYVGHYERGVTPIADTDSSTDLPDNATFAPGRYELVIQAEGYGMTRRPLFVKAGTDMTMTKHVTHNWASKTNGATVVAVPPSDEDPNLIDDTEATNWTSTTAVNVDVAKPFAIVQLGSGEQLVRSVRVSAYPQPGQAESRFGGLRRFQISVCDTNNPNPTTCLSPTDYTPVYTSPDNVNPPCDGNICTDNQVPFPGVAPRPVAPDLTLREFDVDDAMATHVMLTVLDNQCTGAPDYQGEQDNDPINATDCSDNSTAAQTVHTAELEVFSYDQVNPPPDPAVTMVMQGPATATAGSTITYQITYQNLGPNDAADAQVTDDLPSGTSFVDASDGGTNAGRTVKWNLGTVPAGATATLSLQVKIAKSLPLGTALLNQARFEAPNTTATPAAAGTFVSG